MQRLFLNIGWFFLLVLIFISTPSTVLASDTLIYSMTNGSDGKWLDGSPIVVGTKIYGMVAYGVDGIFSVDTDGSDFTMLHSFIGGADDGINPFNNSLIENSGVLYGMTSQGGDNNAGVIFSMNLDGSSYTLLHEFGGLGDGNQPEHNLTLVNNKLYGLTGNGGSNGNGIIFSINLDGSGYTIEHNFTTLVNGRPTANSVIAINNILYGVTEYGGASNTGVVFSFNLSNSTISVLHTFTVDAGNGQRPRSYLVNIDNVLYGSTHGADANLGSIFKINTDGSGFALLHEFAGGISDGSLPYSSLSVYNGLLYGTASEGGASNQGIIYSINPDGSDFTILHSFAGSTTDAAYPYDGNLAYSNYKFYGFSDSGGSANAGAIFSYDLPIPTPTPVPVATATNRPLSNPSAPEIVCNAKALTYAPNNFSVVRNGSSAILYFNPVNEADSYTIAYGFEEERDLYAVIYHTSVSSGTLTYEIKSLLSDKDYIFHIHANNGCARGPWSNYVNSLTTNEFIVSTTPSPTSIPVASSNQEDTFVSNALALKTKVVPIKVLQGVAIAGGVYIVFAIFLVAFEISKLLLPIYSQTGRTLLAYPSDLIKGVFQYIPYIIGNVGANLFGSKKKKEIKDGQSYISTTNDPLGGVYIIFFSSSGNLASAVTGFDGTYKVTLKPDDYDLRAEKMNYNFPSKIVHYESNDFRSRIYIPNKKLVITEKNTVINDLSVPLDPK